MPQSLSISSAEGSPSESLSDASTDDEAPVCWICLGGELDGSKNNPLAVSCKCSKMMTHRLCLAKWQLHRAGTRSSLDIANSSSGMGRKHKVSTEIRQFGLKLKHGHCGGRPEGQEAGGEDRRQYVGVNICHIRHFCRRP